MQNAHLQVQRPHSCSIVSENDNIVQQRAGNVVRFSRSGLEPDRRARFVQEDGIERSVGFRDDRVVEVAGHASWRGLKGAVQLLRTNDAVEPWREVLFDQCGELFVEAAPAADADDEVVCACKGITQGELRAFAALGADRAAIGRACGAGTACGGCGPLIDEIAGHGTMLAAEFVQVTRLDRDVARFRFRYASDVALRERPGSHVLLQALVGDRWITRPYTLVSASENCVEIIVKREPCGLFSRWLHDHASPLSAFRLSLPQEREGLVSSRRTVFIAAGVGITPAFLRVSPNRPDALSVHWSVRGTAMAGLVDAACSTIRSAGHHVTIRDTVVAGRQSEWGALFPPGCAEAVVVCGGVSFQNEVVLDLVSAGWSRDAIVVESFGQRQTEPAGLQHVDSFDYVQEPVVAESFHLAPTSSVRDEAKAFLRQFYYEHGAPAAFDARWATVSTAIEATGTYTLTYEELAFGARLAWRNSARCIGRFFWKMLQVRDCRHLRTEEEMFAAIVKHLEVATNGGDITPIITVFPSGEPRIRILNPQLVLYAGYRRPDGSVIGDPKNVELTEVATRLGWSGAGSRFDVLPVMIQIGDATPKVFELPRGAVLEVELSHPRNPDLAELGLRWFAVPAVSGMALDVGGIQFTAAPSNGFYMGTEIGSMNLADPSRYDELRRVAQVMGYDASGADPLWRDQAMLDLNVAVLHSFAKAGVRILDHHTMSDFFVKFREAEARAKRPSYGHWAWVMPPMGGNLSPIWRDNTLQKKILKPNYFYQPAFQMEPDGDRGRCPAHKAGDANVPPASALQQATCRRALDS